MKIAVSGAHVVGKSTLVEALAAALPGYATVDEPYAQLADEGHDFGDEPSVEDFEVQLERSIADVRARGGDVIFERCPVDFVAYLRAHDEAELFDEEDWLPAVRRAMERLDLVVFVPIEARVALPRSEDARLRRAVDEELRALLVDDALGLGVEVVEVTGSVRERVAQVLARVQGG